MKGKNIAYLSAIAQVFRIISGPLVIIVIAEKLSSEMMSFYYAFFNVIALQQILEMGIGFVIKQHVSHEYKAGHDGHISVASAQKIFNFYKFSLKWYLLIAIFVVLGVGGGGTLFFADYSGPINWLGPWWLLVISTSLFTLLTPIQLLVEGCQRQSLLHKAKIISALISASTLCIALFLDFELYSIAISLIASNAILYIILWPARRKIVAEIKNDNGVYDFKDVLKELWPMLSRLSVTWILGYFFWNSFNLIGFKLLSLDMAGKLGFTLSLARAGYSIVDSIVSSQATIYGNLISSNKIAVANKNFRKILGLCFAVLLVGYFFYLSLYALMPELNIVRKGMAMTESIFVFLFFLVLFPVTSMALFCRSFKKEPFFGLSLALNILTPVIFTIVCYYMFAPLFLYLLVPVVGAFFWSVVIYKNTLLE